MDAFLTDGFFLDIFLADAFFLEKCTINCSRFITVASGFCLIAVSEGDTTSSGLKIYSAPRSTKCNLVSGSLFRISAATLALVIFLPLITNRSPPAPPDSFTLTSDLCIFFCKIKYLFFLLRKTLSRKILCAKKNESSKDNHQKH